MKIMEKRIVKVNKHTQEAICRLSKDEFRDEPEVAQKRREALEGKEVKISDNINQLFETENYLYLSVKKMKQPKY